MSADDKFVTPQPSWAPLLQQEKLQSPIGMDQSCDFNAAPSIDGCISIDSKEGLLKCRGLVVDTIEYYSDEILPEYFLEWEKSDSDPEYNHFVEELWDEMVLASSPPSTVYSETELLEAFSRTLMASLGRIELAQVGGSTPILKEFYIRFVKHPDHPEHPLGKALESVQRSDDEDIEPLMTSAFAAGAKRKFFRTERGYFGLGPAVMGVGDSCCVLFGSNVPHLLLHTPKNGRYKFLGEAYVHGLMNGEAMEMWEEGTLDLQEFEIM